MDKKGKKGLKIAIIISAVIIIVIAIILSLMFFTDIFKSNKEIFIKDLTQFLGKEETDNNKLISYFNKKQTTPSKNKGEINTDNAPVIAFEGQNDPTKKTVEQNIEIQYSDDVTFPITYKSNDDIYGIQTEYVSSKYIAIENNNLKEFARKLGINTSNIPNKIELQKENQKQPLTEEEKSQLKEKYMPILDKISEDKITKAKNNERSTYTLTLTAQEVQDILKELFETLKNDDILLNQISTNQNMQTQIKEYLEQMIDSMEESLTQEDGNLQIVLETVQGIPNKLEIQVPDLTITIQKNKADKLTYSIGITSKEDKCTLLASFQGLDTQEQITENYELYISTIKDGKEYSGKYNYTNNITFVDAVDIEPLTDENSMILNEYNTEQIYNFIQKLVERISQVNEDQMKELKIEDGVNPLINYLNPLPMQ